MLYLKERKLLIKSPSEINGLDVELKNQLYEDLKKGHVLFEFPFDFTFVANTNHWKNYKVGFLYDCLTLIYPDMGKTGKWEVISNMYHLFFTYRRFKDVLDEYNIRKREYLGDRKLLQRS